ncbi:glycosyltransferase [Agromyces mediolanus]|uniref:Glycosyltransferase subfamily 4-like N-terminal domain-containing protein n=1 Tax=Agromyces mediolanus TaxID=41986 RepID=A0A918CP78_AGRME|nr:glycosyltransferase [Agromyces mediolanus]GGR34503.1 hypothetical protein GCM10010196_30700 [Agromyces mediolanus]GLJ74120.1 hypothetical protein GCM10017583_33790 [Agromyces mediolanus]
MRILFVHEVNYLEKVIFEMHEFPELLALRGHEVSFYHFPEASGERSAPSLRTTRERVRGRVHPDANLELITPPHLGGGGLDRYLAPVIDVPGLRREIRDGGYDVIVLYAVPTTGWQTVAFAKRFGVPVVFRALDVSHLIRRTPVAPLIRRAEHYVYRNASLLSANNPAMADYCVEASGRTGPTQVDLPPVDLSHFADEGVRIDRSTIGLREDDEVLLYMGTFFEFSGLDTVLEALVPEFARRPRLRVVLVGGGELEPELRRIVERESLGDRVVFTGVVPYAQLPGYLRLADVAINPFRPELVTHVALPHKVLQYMAAGVPVVSTALHGIVGILGDDAGVTWAAEPAAVAAEALALLDTPTEHRRGIVERQRDTALRTFSEAASVSGFEETLRSID